MLTISLLLLYTLGCNPAEDAYSGADGKLDAWLVESFRDIAIEEAIVRQHTIYPYHFENNSDELNELGDRDLEILATHYREHPGKLNVRKGTVSEDLYKMRIDTVVNTLLSSGIEMERVDIGDRLPGGDGMPSEKVVAILRQEDEFVSQPPSYTSDYSAVKGAR
jgi:hypothetical protein